ncbi:MAG: restriction endonuclease subunit S, partial [Bacteroidales bacterium]|nr:restriction endonuclease subunit S [Bacteroidales bacterium]
MEWKKVKLGDCCDITSSKRFHLSERTQTGVPFYCTKEIIQKLRGDKKIDCDYIPEDLYLDIKKKFGVPTKDDLLLTTRGTIGIPYLYKDTDRFYFADGNLSWFRKFNDYLNPNYLYYWFLSPNGRFFVNSIAVGTAQKAVPIAGLMNLTLSLPPLPSQRRISSILSDYDSLIENYQRQISLLEESAKRIYKEWFVDFKFPGVEMAENGLPKGWQKKKLGEICEITAGGDKPKIFSENQNKHCNIPVFSNGTSNYGLFGYTNKAIVFDNSITISARGSIGYVCLREEPFVP